MSRIKSSSTVTVPALVGAVAVTTQPAPGTDPASGLRSFASAHLIVRRRVAGRWRADHESHHTSPVTLWDRIDAYARDRQRVYLCAPEPAELLTLTHWWERVRDGRYVVWRPATPAGDGGEVVGQAPRRRTHPLILSGVPTVVGWDYRRCPYRLTGCRQFGEPDLHLDGDSAGDARSVIDWLTKLMQRWLDSGCGSWRDTIGAASWNTYTMRCQSDPLVRHTDPEALVIEDEACHGGRAALWCGLPVGTRGDWLGYIDRPAYPRAPGHLPGPLYRLDVRGMYPTIMRDQLFPTRLVGLSYGWSVKRLDDSLGCGLKLARVRIRSRVAEYPARAHGKPWYPTGTYITTLAEPELTVALARREVEHVYAVARYEAGHPFAEWGNWVLSLRRRAKRYGPPEWASYVKGLAVALSGRLGRRAGGWVDRPRLPARVTWGEWPSIEADGGVVTWYRSLGGHVQEREPNGPRTGTHAACYAYITSYGRAQMRRYRELCPTHTVIAQHTDGLTVLPEAESALRRAGAIRPQEWGHLDHEGTIDCAWFRSPNHYWADGGWTVAGVADGWTILGDSDAEERLTVDPARSARDPSAGIIGERVRRIALAEMCQGEHFGQDGWTVPPHSGEPFD